MIDYHIQQLYVPAFFKLTYMLFFFYRFHAMLIVFTSDLKINEFFYVRMYLSSQLHATFSLNHIQLCSHMYY